MANRTELYVYEQAAVLLSCTLSALGSALIIFTYIAWPELRSAPRRLLVCLSATDMLSALSFGYGAWRMFQRETWDCVLQGALSTLANTSSFFWTVAIAVYLYIFIVRSDQRLADSLVSWFHLVSWGVPLGITVAALCLHKIGYDASEVSVGWCWVSLEAPDHVLWMLLTGKIWEFLAYLTLPVLYILIRKHIRRAHAALSEYRPILSSSQVAHTQSSMADRKMTLIPIIFIGLRIWSTLRFLLMLADLPARQNPVLVTLHGIGNTFQGAANCTMFVFFTKVVRSRLAALFCCCCRGEQPTHQFSRGLPQQHLLPDGDTETGTWRTSQ
ncbi:putative G-protein coupled receptor 157 [Arapaima gigas]